MTQFPSFFPLFFFFLPSFAAVPGPGPTFSGPKEGRRQQVPFLLPFSSSPRSQVSFDFLRAFEAKETGLFFLHSPPGILSNFLFPSEVRKMQNLPLPPLLLHPCSLFPFTAYARQGGQRSK